MNSQVALTSPINHQGQTEGSIPAKIAGVFGFLVIGTGLSVTVTPIIGAFGFVYYGFTAINYNSIKNLYSERLQSLISEYDSLANKNLQSSGVDVTELKNLERRIKIVEGYLADAKFSAANSHRDFVASLILVLPLFGLAGAAIYLKLTDENVEDTGVHGCVEAFVSWSTPGWAQDLVNGPLHYGGGIFKDRIENSEIAKRGCEKWGQFRIKDSFIAKTISVKIDDLGNKDNLEVYQSTSFDASKPCMVIFHGNGDNKYNQYCFAKEWVDQGYSVIVATMRGYSGSGSNISTSELSTIQDTNAILEYLSEMGVTKIGVDATSIGGTLAFPAAQLRPDLVKVVIANQTLTSGKNVAANVVKKIDYIGWLAPTSVIRGIVSGALRPERVPGVRDSEGNPYYTDGMNNIKKVKVLKDRNIALVAIKSTQDGLMGRDWKEDESTGWGKYQRNFADDLIEARYGKGSQNLIEVEGGHCAQYPLNDVQAIVMKAFRDDNMKPTKSN